MAERDVMKTNNSKLSKEYDCWALLAISNPWVFSTKNQKSWRAGETSTLGMAYLRFDTREASTQCNVLGFTASTVTFDLKVDRLFGHPWTLCFEHFL